MHVVDVVKLTGRSWMQEDCAPYVKGDAVLLTSAHYDKPGVLPSGRIYGGTHIQQAETGFPISR